MEVKVKKYIIILLFLAFNVAGYCGQTSRIELIDGSVINGEIVSLANGSYSINTASLGVIKVDTLKVAKIESVQPSAPSAILNSSVQPNSLTSEQINSYKQKIMSNPENVAAIKSLATNPQVQALAQDPEIVNAVKSGNIQELINNKKLIAVLGSSEVEETVKKVKQ